MDFSWVDTAVGGGTALTGYLLGQARGRRRSGRQRDPEAVCGCGHHYSLHDHHDNHHDDHLARDDGRACHGTDRVKTAAGNDGVTWVSQPCGCRRYTGPEPLPLYTP